MTNLVLEKALAVIDLETTGLRVETDRIVEISVLLLRPDGTRESRTRRVNPEIPIPPEASAIHGITDADVAEEPRFSQLAAGLLEFLGDADIAGYNVAWFDLPLLAREFERAGRPFSMQGRAVVDAMAIYKRHEPRNLAAAYRFYCGRERDDLHSAGADVQACAEILEAQLGRYPDLPREPAALDAQFRRGEPGLDRQGKLTWKEGEAAINFGRMRGSTLRELVANDPSYLGWILTSDFPLDTKEIIRAALSGTYPTPPK